MRLITRGSEFKIRRILPKWIFHLLLNALCLGAPIMNEKETGICPHLTKCRKVSPFQLSSSSSNLICIEPFLMNFALSPVLVFQNAKLCVSPVLTKLVSHVYISTISLPPPPLCHAYFVSLSLSLSLCLSPKLSHCITYTHPTLPTHSFSVTQSFLHTYNKHVLHTYTYHIHIHSHSRFRSCPPTSVSRC